MKLYKQAGAGYVVPVAVHHDNFDMWDSKYQPRFNSVATCGKDIVGMWQKATVANGLHLAWPRTLPAATAGCRFRTAATRRGRSKGVPYDGATRLSGPVRRALERHQLLVRAARRRRAALGTRISRTACRPPDKYHPDLYYTDGGLPFEQAGLNIVSHLYNENQKWNNGQLDAVATIKLDWQPNIAVFNYEFGYTGEIREYPWQSDKTINDEWYWVRNDTRTTSSPTYPAHA